MRAVTTESTTHPVLIFWIAAGWVGFALLPWYGVEDFWFLDWLTDGWPTDADYAPGAFLLAQGEKPWLWPLVPALLAPLFVMGGARPIRSLPISCWLRAGSALPGSSRKGWASA